jgi:hypothetical protein
MSVGKIQMLDGLVSTHCKLTAVKSFITFGPDPTVPISVPTAPIFDPTAPIFDPNVPI